MKLLRTIRLDASDSFIFAEAAAPGEWAVPGGFAFADGEPEQLQGKALAAFRSGFLGLTSLGWSTLAQVVEAEEADCRAATALLARALLERFGAPDAAAAEQAAAEEIAFTAALCEHPPATLIALHRSAENGAIRESFRSLRARGGRKPWQALTFEAAEDEKAEPVDLAALARRRDE